MICLGAERRRGGTALALIASRRITGGRAGMMAWGGAGTGHARDTGHGDNRRHLRKRAGRNACHLRSLQGCRLLPLKFFHTLAQSFQLSPVPERGQNRDHIENQCAQEERKQKQHPYRKRNMEVPGEE
ncbi:hypothetical protein A4R35_21180 [Thermogemmatispora tikiterensis]|uniref:Uncharacterized protein n=1 Tax=Thermogemmatispora tikiterensis TaxID=1825093 RepID=A0A328VKU0_9CHLR|nr:hypothetical protein A4R35_21180 [Thermogemmatispora tikiterensis]